MKQTSFFKTKDFPKEFGGGLNKGKRKTKRPLSSKKPVHIILKADLKKGENLFRYRKTIKDQIHKFSQEFEIKIYEQGLARDHFHLL